MQIIVFYLGDVTVNHDAPKLIRYLLALTGCDPCQARSFRGQQCLNNAAM